MTKSLKINAALNTIKTLCQVVFPIITIPYISRILGTENYGKVNYTASIISYFALFAAFGINNYAAREGASVRNDKKKFERLANQLFTINLITTIISLAVLSITVFFVKFSYDHRILLLIQGTTILFTVIGADWVNTIFEDYFYITVRYICVQVVSLMLLLLMVKKSDDFIIYAAILTIANSGANIFNIFYIRKYVKIRPIISNGMITHVKPMLTLVVYSFALTIYVNSDTTLLGILKSDMDVGIYSIAAKIYLVIKQVLNASIVVSIPRISALLGNHKCNEYRKLLSKIFDFLLIIVLPSMVGVFMISKNIIFFAGGVEYQDASFPLQILSISLCFAVFGCFFSNCILLPNKCDKSMLVATLVGCISNVILNFILIPYISYIGAAITTLIAELFVLSILVYKSKGIEKVDINKRNVISVLLGCVAIGLICVIVNALFGGYIVSTILSIILSVISYPVILLLLKNTTAIEVMKYIRNKSKKEL